MRFVHPLSLSLPTHSTLLLSFLPLHWSTLFLKARFVRRSSCLYLYHSVFVSVCVLVRSANFDGNVSIPRAILTINIQVCIRGNDKSNTTRSLSIQERSDFLCSITTWLVEHLFNVHFLFSTSSTGWENALKYFLRLQIGQLGMVWACASLGAQANLSSNKFRVYLKQLNRQISIRDWKLRSGVIGHTQTHNMHFNLPAIDKRKLLYVIDKRHAVVAHER